MQGGALEVQGRLGDVAVGDRGVALLAQLDLERGELGDLAPDPGEALRDVLSKLVGDLDVAAPDLDSHASPPSVVWLPSINATPRGLRAPSARANTAARDRLRSRPRAAPRRRREGRAGGQHVVDEQRAGGAAPPRRGPAAGSASRSARRRPTWRRPSARRRQRRELEPGARGERRGDLLGRVEARAAAGAAGPAGPGTIGRRTRSPRERLRRARRAAPSREPRARAPNLSAATRSRATPSYGGRPDAASPTPRDRRLGRRAAAASADSHARRAPTARRSGSPQAPHRGRREQRDEHCEPGPSPRRLAAERARMARCGDRASGAESPTADAPPLPRRFSRRRRARPRRGRARSRSPAGALPSAVSGSLSP